MIIVFAREPVPGRAKTRLIPRLGEWGAARLQARLIRHAMTTAQAARCGPVELHFSKQQKGKDLGERMYHALSRARRPAVLIGTDAPEIRPADLRRAHRLLAAGYDAVLMPAEDGGYALVGLRRVSAALFSGIAWGGPDVYAETVKRLSGWRWRELRTVWDVDRPDDLDRLRWLRLSSALRRAARR
jgi:glycosyltransferase A (GT-A) superfamily protein (DUF2064 family)